METDIYLPDNLDTAENVEAVLEELGICLDELETACGVKRRRLNKDTDILIFEYCDTGRYLELTVRYNPDPTPIRIREVYHD